LEIDWLGGLIHSYVSYNLNKYISVQANLGVNGWNKQNKNFMRSFGVGIKYETKGQEDLMDIEEDFSEYEYDRL
jgi:hypothetical protein